MRYAIQILEEVPFDFVLLRPSLEICAERAALRQEGTISDYVELKNFTRALKRGPSNRFVTSMMIRSPWPTESLTG